MAKWRILHLKWYDGHIHSQHSQQIIRLSNLVARQLCGVWKKKSKGTKNYFYWKFFGIHAIYNLRHIRHLLMHPTFTNLFLLYSFPMHSFLSRVLCNTLINFNFRRNGKKFNKFSDSNRVFDEIYLNSLWYSIKIPRQHRIFNFAKCHWFSLNKYIQNSPKRLNVFVNSMELIHILEWI